MQAPIDLPGLDSVFAALADSTRRAVVARLAAEGELCALELARPFEISQPAVSRHLKVLESAGLIIRRVDGSRRPCRLAPAAIGNLNQWLAHLRRSLERNYSQLDAVLEEVVSTRKERR
jgi:DNA-binding transcriptional ArsR family regulator